jgi:hypothetical protein
MHVCIRLYIYIYIYIHTRIDNVYTMNMSIFDMWLGVLLSTSGHTDTDPYLIWACVSLKSQRHTYTHKCCMHTYPYRLVQSHEAGPVRTSIPSSPAKKLQLPQTACKRARVINKLCAKADYACMKGERTLCARRMCMQMYIVCTWNGLCMVCRICLSITFLTIDISSCNWWQ